MTREAVFHTAFWVLFGGVLVMRLYSSLRVRQAGERVMPDQEAVEREGRAVFGVRVFMFFLLIAWLVLYAINPSWMGVLSVPLPDWLRWVGVAVGFASLVLWTWTQAVLGKEWSPQLQLRGEHRLVTTGPYARVRHPLYTAMLGWGVGVALVTANWVFVVMVVAVIGGMMARVPREEQMPTALLLIVRTALEDRTLLNELVGYREYVQQTRCRLLPGVW